MMKKIEKIPPAQFKNLLPIIAKYSKALGLKEVRGRFSSELHLTRICAKFPEINAFVRPEGGRVTQQQNAKMFLYMVENPIGLFRIKADLLDTIPKSKGKPKAKRKSPAKPASSKLEFYASWDWKKARYKALQKHGATCMLCGARRGDTASDGEPVRICVDHIKPLSKFWGLRLDQDNLQVLCHDCNMGKGAWDETDWRDEGSILDDEPMTPIEIQLGERMH